MLGTLRKESAILPGVIRWFFGLGASVFDGRALSGPYSYGSSENTDKVRVVKLRGEHYHIQARRMVLLARFPWKLG